MKGKIPLNFRTMQQRTWVSVDFYSKGQFVRNYPSVRKAAEDLGIQHQNIHNYLKNKIKYLRSNPEWHFEHKKEKR